MILRNVRLPVQLWGDIQAQIASNVVAERRIVELMQSPRPRPVRVASSRRRSTTRGVASCSGSSGIENGAAEASDVHRGRRSRTRPADDPRAGRRSGPTASRAISPAPTRRSPRRSTRTLACTKAAVICSVVAVRRRRHPAERRARRADRGVAPEGRLVNPVSPAPAFGATADPSDRVSEAVLRALAQLAPNRVPAGSYSTGNNVTGGGLRPDGSQFLWYSYQAGGCGARPWADGNSAEWHLMANSRNESMEVWETRYPVEFLSFRLIPDSGGAGSIPRRARDGTPRARSRSPRGFRAFPITTTIGAVGVQGGRARPSQRVRARARRDRRRSLETSSACSRPRSSRTCRSSSATSSSRFRAEAAASATLTSVTRERVRADVEAGYVSPEQAAVAYGYEADE